MDDGNHAVIVRRATKTIKVTKLPDFFRVPDSILSNRNGLAAYASLDSQSTASFIDSSIKVKEVASSRHRC